MNFRDKIYIMGILNITEDSFFDGRKYFEKNKALERALKLIEDGADIIDIGGESSKPHSIKVSEKEEASRVIEIISEIKKHKNVIISVDTYKSYVAREALKCGAHIVNDVYGGLYDEKIFDVVKEFNSYICITHNRNPVLNEYKNIVSEVYEELELRINKGISKNISREKILIDFGLGFSKYGENNLPLIKSINKFKDLGFPILFGCSRKKFLKFIDNKDPLENIESTIGMNLYAAINGANILRVHDVLEHRKIIDGINSLMYGGV